MKVSFFYHSLVSDWNHGNAHFLRGIALELLSRGHEVKIFEPQNSWSKSNLLQDHGTKPIEEFNSMFPNLRSAEYSIENLDLDWALDGTDLVLVHEWNDPELVKKIGDHRSRVQNYNLLFHDTHHRMVTSPDEMQKYDLSHYDGVLAFGEVIRDLYLRKGLCNNAWTWHEAADIRTFTPITAEDYQGELVWIGNWGDEERTEELNRFVIDSIRDLNIKATFYGVRYPLRVQENFKKTGIRYNGWVANYKVPQIFGQHQFTVHVPRRPYAEALPGIPTIRIFESLACEIPLVSAPWWDTENLFCANKDYLLANDERQMRQHFRFLINEPQAAKEIARSGRETILKKHTCTHRVDELLNIVENL